MRGISWERVLQLVDEDVRRVKDVAWVVITIAENNETFEVATNKDPRLGVLAIIGPSSGFGQSFPEVLLCEVGVGRSRPYNATGVNNGSPQIPKRRKWFRLSEEQYTLTAPFVFEYLQKRAQNVVRSWKSGSDFWLPSPRGYWSRNQNKLFCSTVWRLWPKGVKFSFPLDTPFIEDILWAERNLNLQVANAIGGLARFIDTRLSNYKRMEGWRGVKPFKNLKGVRDVEEAMDKIPPHLRGEVLKRLPSGPENRLYNELLEHFGLWDLLKEDGKENPLPNPEARLGNIQLRITSPPCDDRKYAVCEVFADSRQEEVPF